jgi:hypothetical protein
MLIHPHPFSLLGLMPEALRVVKEMQLTGKAPDLYTYNTLISGYAQLGNIEMIKSLIGVGVRGVGV